MTGNAPKYRLCGCCGSWLKRDWSGVYRHRRGDGTRCRAQLAGKVRSIANHGCIPMVPPPASEYHACLFCGLEAETDPGGLCPACLGKRQVEKES